jgi:hypothetical protein
MTILKEIIGWEEPEDNLESRENRPPVSDVEESRPDFCPCCSAPARYCGKLLLVGHGSYERWAKIPQVCRRETSVRTNMQRPSASRLTGSMNVTA